MRRVKTNVNEQDRATFVQSLALWPVALTIDSDELCDIPMVAADDGSDEAAQAVCCRSIRY